MNGVNEKGSAEAATSPSHGSNNPSEDNSMNSEIYSREATRCEVFSLAARHREQRDIGNKYSKRSAEVGIENDIRGCYLEIAATHNYEIEHALGEMIASTEAASLEGAAYQVSLVLNRVNDLFYADDDDSKRMLDFRAANRMLYSILHAIDMQCPQPLCTTFGDDFANGNLDPWTDVDERLDFVQGVSKGDAEERSSHRAAGSVGPDAANDTRPCLRLRRRTSEEGRS